jgi:uncharacterized protein YaaR (DUF327 family)
MKKLTDMMVRLNEINFKESKSLKREIDFKSDGAFKKYNAKHKMRKTTKVTIAGKDTTAGEAGGTHAAASRDGAYTFDKGDAKIDYDKEWEKRKARIKSTPDIKSGDSLGKTSSGKDMVVYKNNKAFFLNEVLVNWYSTKNSLSSNLTQKIKDAYRVYRFHQKFSKIKSIYYLLILSINSIKRKI